MNFRSPLIFTKKGFTLVELIVGMVIFSVAMTAILALLHSTISQSLFSRHEIVTANLLREQVELIENVRNTNLRSFAPFDRVRLEASAGGGLGSGIYLIENNFPEPLANYDAGGNLTRSPVYMKDVSTSFPPSLEGRFTQARLYLDDHGRFTHTQTPRPTQYASYMIVTPLSYDKDGAHVEVKKDGKYQGYILDGRVIVNFRGYREYDIRSIITDWKK